MGVGPRTSRGTTKWDTAAWQELLAMTGCLVFKVDTSTVTTLKVRKPVIARSACYAAISMTKESRLPRFLPTPGLRETARNDG